MRLPLAIPVLAFAACTALPGPASAEIRRCGMPDGNIVYTDRSCHSLGGRELPREAATVVQANRLYHGRCAATLPDLVYEVTSAIDSHDVNRLAAAYHWPGLSGGTANATMRRLESISDRALLDLRVVTTDVPVEAADPGNPFATPAVRVVPTGLRAEQVLPDGTTPVATHFALRRHLGCWWVRL